MTETWPLSTQPVAVWPLITPAAVKLVLPPTVVAGALLGAALLAADGGGTVEVRRFLDGAGQAMLLPVGPAMVSLGLYTHTHAGLLRAAWRPLLAATALAAPLGMLAVAFGGRAAGGAFSGKKSSVQKTSQTFRKQLPARSAKKIFDPRREAPKEKKLCKKAYK